MKRISETILFFGSGPVAAESLRLLAQDFTIEAVVTKPRPPHHKGDVPVMRVATQLGLTVFTASNKTQLDALFATSPVESRIGVLIDFGIIVSQKVIDYFPLGIINSHFSLLPQWRGADPITFSILSGQRRTGVSLMLLVEKMDEGPLLAQTPFDTENTMTTPQLTDALIDVSYRTLQQILPLYLHGEATPAPQNAVTLAPTTPTYSRQLTKDDGWIDWHKTAGQLEREVRAYAGWPKSRTRIGNIEIVITKARTVEEKGNPGVRAISNGEAMVYCGKGALILDELKPAGKKAMSGKAFLAGYRTAFIEAG